MRASVARPSLNALRAFEATARLGSMTAAADELCVTHGAISRSVRALEDQLGVVLLVRGSQATEPTPEGARLAEGLSSAFRLIQASVEQLRPGPLTLSCSSSIMMYWLLPRLAGFHQAHPGVELKFDMGHDRIDFVRDNIGMAVRLSSFEPPRDAIVRELMVEAVGPVCSPDYMRSAGIESPEDLERARLLATRTRPGAWAEWRDAAGVPLPQLRIADSYDHFYLLIQAAVCGLGIAAVPRMLVLDDLRAGKLVAPFGFVPGPHRLVLWTAPHLARDPHAQALGDWLAQEMAAT